MPPDLHSPTVTPNPTRLLTMELGRYRAVFRVRTALRLPAYAGSLWRGTLGHALQEVFCQTRRFDCRPCELRRDCLYAQLLETAPDPKISLMRDQAMVPHPMVLHIPAPNHPVVHQPGARIELEFSLFGEANDQIPALIQGLTAMANRGFGRGEGRLGLERVELLDPALSQGPARLIFEGGCFYETGLLPPAVLPQAPDQIRINLITPLRLKQRGQMITGDRLDITCFIRALVRRISLVNTFHGRDPLSIHFEEVWEQARNTRIRQRALRHYKWARYSSRQKRTIRMDGILGHMTLDLRGQEALWPFLWWGQHLLMGKGTIMGLGRYSLN